MTGKTSEPIAGRYHRFWFEFELPRVKLVWFRVAFFTVLGCDAFSQIQHAPRYGAGDFNVPHVPGLDAILPFPDRAGMLVVFLLQAHLAFRIALGGATRASMWLLTALFGYSYFISQLNSYQHHYLVFLLLVVCCAIPWRTSPAPEPSVEPGAETVTSWAVRLVMVQVAIVYLWAAIAKLDPLWLDGAALTRQISAQWARELIESIGFGLTAKLIVIAELALAIAWLIRRLWLPAWLLGVGFHISIELSGFHIGLFTYIMLALYLLLVPDRLARWLAAIARGGWRHVTDATAGAARLLASHGSVFVAAVTLAGIGGALAILSLPFDRVMLVAALASALAGLGIGLTLWPPLSRDVEPHARRAAAVAIAGAHLVSCLCLVGLDATTDQAFNYYKYWGGTSRRLGVADDAKAAYQAVTRVRPSWAPGHYYLARIAATEGRTDDAMASYRRAQRANPDDYRAFLGEAELHDQAGRGADARAAAARALTLRPRNHADARKARKIVQRWSGSRAPPGTAP